MTERKRWSPSQACAVHGRMECSLYGLAIKVSEDGPITVYKSGKTHQGPGSLLGPHTGGSARDSSRHADFRGVIQL
jgi:hypothetical protein